MNGNNAKHCKYIFSSEMRIWEEKQIISAHPFQRRFMTDKRRPINVHLKRHLDHSGEWTWINEMQINDVIGYAYSTRVLAVLLRASQINPLVRACWCWWLSYCCSYWLLSSLWLWVIFWCCCCWGYCWHSWANLMSFEASDWRRDSASCHLIIRIFYPDTAFHSCHNKSSLVLFINLL